MHGSDEKKFREVVRDDWSLEEILDFSPQYKERLQQVTAHTTSELVNGGSIQISFNTAKYKINFDTLEGERILQNIEKSLCQKKIQYENGVNKIELEEEEVVIEIGLPDSENISNVTIKFDKFNNISRLFKNAIGLGDILNLLPTPTPITKEFAEDLLKRGEIRMGNRSIPLTIASDPEQLSKMTSYFGKDRKNILFHGTSLATALQIAQHGLRSEICVRPTLSDKADGTAFKLAKNLWEGYKRSDPSSFGAIIVFNVLSDEIRSHGGMISRS